MAASVAAAATEHAWHPVGTEGAGSDTDGESDGRACEPSLRMTIRYRTVDSNLVAGPVAGFLWPSAQVTGRRGHEFGSLVQRPLPHTTTATSRRPSPRAPHSPNANTRPTSPGIIADCPLPPQRCSRNSSGESRAETVCESSSSLGLIHRCYH